MSESHDRDQTPQDHGHDHPKHELSFYAKRIYAIRDLLLDYGLHDKLWMVGGNIPEVDRLVLRQLGYRGVFPTGSRTEEIVAFIRENVK